MSRLITSEEPKECKLTLKTPYRELETDTYVVMGKANGEKFIEVNNLGIEEIEIMIKRLQLIIKSNF